MEDERGSGDGEEERVTVASGHTAPATPSGHAGE